MTLDEEVAERNVINKVKCLACMLRPTEENPRKKPSMTTAERLFAIHQEIDQYLFGGDGNLTYVGKIMELKEKGQI